MKKVFLFSAFLTLAVMVKAQDKLYADEFSLGDVTLLDGPLKKARDLNIKTLLQYDSDRLLAPFLKEAGLNHEHPVYTPLDNSKKIEDLAMDILKHYKRQYYCVGTIYKICDYMIENSSAREEKEQFALICEKCDQLYPA